MRQLFLIACLATLASGCVSTEAAHEQPIAPVSCKTGPDCDMKWSRAIEWVSQNAGYKIQTQTDALIQTYGPSGSDTELAVTVNKVMVSPGIYEIHARMGCANEISCFAEPHTELQRFAAFINAK